MYCKNCGKKIEEIAKYCQYCGSKLPIIEEDVKTNSSKEIVNSEHEDIEKNITKKQEDSKEIKPKEDIENRQEKAYMSMPLWKLIFLDILSCGWYKVVWFYKHWQIATYIDKKKRSIILESFFGFVTCFWLFPKISKFYEGINPNQIEKGKERNCCSILDAIIICICTYMYSNLGRSLYYTPEDSLVLTLYIFLFFTSLYLLVLIQSRINSRNNNHKLKFEYNGWSWKSTVFAIVALTVCWVIPFIVGFKSM